jgi:hypothetical protein
VDWNERTGLARFRLGMFTLRGERERRRKEEDDPYVTKKRMWFIYY